jgi:hypothetical protein
MNSCASEKSLNKFYSEIPNTEVNQPNASQPYTPTH